jgi:hypothetical protein
MNTAAARVIPAEAGIHEHRRVKLQPSMFMDSGFRRNDGFPSLVEIRISL